MSARSATPEALYDLIRMVRPLYKALEAAVERELTGTGISVIQRAVLERLTSGGPQTVPEIGRGLIAPRQFIQKVVNELLDRGLIERRRNQAHKRSLLIALTADGEATIRRILAREAEVMRPIARDFDPSALAAAQAVVAEMIERFRTSPSQQSGDQP